MHKAIVKDEGIMLGKPTIAGTRLTVELILEKLAAGEGVGRIVESYPRLDREAVREALLFAAGRVEEVLARLRLAEEPLVDAVTALDDHSEEDERIEAPPRRHFPDEAEPPALLAVAEKVLAADVPQERAIQAMQDLRGSDVPQLLEAVAEAVRTKEARLEWRRPSRDAWPESRVALAFASEVLRIFRQGTDRRDLRILADESVEGEVVARLRSEGHHVAYVPETSAGIRYDEVLARANAENRVLLTEDKDFGDLAFYYGSRSSGIVLVRAHGANVEAMASLVAEALETHEDELTKDPPHFVVLRWGRPPRSRPLRDLGTGGQVPLSGPWDLLRSSARPTSSAQSSLGNSGSTNSSPVSLVRTNLERNSTTHSRPNFSSRAGMCLWNSFQPSHPSRMKRYASSRRLVS